MAGPTLAALVELPRDLGERVDIALPAVGVSGAVAGNGRVWQVSRR